MSLQRAAAGEAGPAPEDDGDILVCAGNEEKTRTKARL